jgi:hypothetical protein
MLKILLITFFLQIGVVCSSQSIELLYGMELYYGKHDLGRKDLNTTHIDNHDPHIKLRLGISPFKNKCIKLVISYHKMRSFASAQIGTPDELISKVEGPVPFINGGTSKTDIYRIGFGAAYNLNLWNDRIKFIPKVILHNEIAVETWEPGFGRAGRTGRYEYEFYSYSNPGYQILPEFVIPIYFKIYRGLHLQFEYSFLWGNRPSMYIEARYTIDEITQPDSRFYNDGTAHQAMMGLSYQF